MPPSRPAHAALLSLLAGLFLSLFPAEAWANNVTQAARLGDLPALRVALETGGNIEARDPDGLTPLMLAAGRGDAGAVQLLLATGADVHRIEGQTGTSALHKAAMGGNPRVIELLLTAGAFVNAQSALNGQTALIDAVWYRQPAAVRALLDGEARIDIPAHLYGTQPPVTALDYAQAEVAADEAAGLPPGAAALILETLETVAAERSARTPLSDLLTAISDGEASGVQSALAAGADPNGRALNGYVPIILAAQEGRLDMVQILLGAGAVPDTTGLVMLATPVHKAAYGGHPNVVAALLEASGPLEAQGPNNGYTALIDAIWRRACDVVPVLLEAGAGTDAVGHDGLTARDQAERLNLRDCLTALDAAALRSTETDTTRDR